MSKERKVDVRIGADTTDFQNGIKEAENRIKDFEKKASKSGIGGGLKSFAAPFAGMLAGGKVMEGAISGATIAFEQFQFAAAAAGGDLDAMAQAALAVNKAQRDLVAGIPMLGRSLSRLMAAMGREQEQRMTGAVAGQKAMAMELDGLRTSAAGLSDELALLKMALAGASAFQVESAKAEIDFQKTLQAEQEKELAILEKLNAAKQREATLAGQQAAWVEEISNIGRMHSGDGLAPIGAAGGLSHDEITELEAQRRTIADAELALVESQKKQAEITERQRVQSELRYQANRDRISKETQKARERIESVELQNALLRTGFIDNVHDRELARIAVEEKAAMDALDRNRAGIRERLAVTETFAARRELVQYGQQAETDAGRRDLQRRMNAPDTTTTAAYVSMSGAVSGGGIDKEQLSVMRQTQKDISTLVKIEKEKRHKEPTIQSREFRRDRLN